MLWAVREPQRPPNPQQVSGSREGTKISRFLAFFRLLFLYPLQIVVLHQHPPEHLKIRYLFLHISRQQCAPVFC